MKKVPVTGLTHGGYLTRKHILSFRLQEASISTSLGGSWLSGCPCLHCKVLDGRDWGLVHQVLSD